VIFFTANETYISRNVAYVGEELYIYYQVDGQPGYLVLVEYLGDGVCEFTLATNLLEYTVFDSFGSRFVGLDATRTIYYGDENRTNLIAVNVDTGVSTVVPLALRPVSDFFYLFSPEDSTHSALFFNRGDNRLYDLHLANTSQTRLGVFRFHAVTKTYPYYFFDVTSNSIFGPDFELRGVGYAFNASGICGSGLGSYSNRPFEYQIGLQFPEPTQEETFESTTTVEETTEMVSTTTVVEESTTTEEESKTTGVSLFLAAISSLSLLIFIQ